MKPAKEIMQKYKFTGNARWEGHMTYEDVEKSMKEYAEDAIRECAERATTKPEQDYDGCGALYDYNVVDKESILNLIEELA